MSNSLASGRRIARRAALLQLAAGVLAAMVAGLVRDMDAAAGALSGATAAALGTEAMARVALGGGIQPARVIHLRMAVGMLLKWLLVIVVLYLAIVPWRLPPLAVLSGLVVAMLVFPLAHLPARSGEQKTR
ncbi:ATP synthase subunit I [Arenimonas composti]|uniref:ATP synthase I n=1 Tax=Arenimonas composti TR7-09 = DSM 18010 TaxID=1121013 RepID=A0A091B7Z4_9GAMM|nr:ATP synthase subunit I [Arenimonas composti]KFN48783.1 hypothetical protein P873_13305 [Arenimonas composti TR7-09 = DSM 18010]